MKKKCLALLLVLTMALSLAACGNNDQQVNDNSSNNNSNSQDNLQQGPGNLPPDLVPQYTVGICQYMVHPALDAATEGFKDALNALLPGQVTFDEKNGAGESNTCTTIANGFVASKVDLIMANATPALTSAATATTDIPILATSITEYGVALGIDNFSGTVGGNISGTSDLAPLDQQAAMIREWFPEAKTVGLLYCSGEPNSQYQVDEVQRFLEEANITCTQYPFSDTNDLPAVTQTAAANSDVIYVPTDNTCAENTGIIDNICRPAGVPIIAGEEGICGGCGVATLSISYYDIGYKTGEMAAQILTNEANISEMPIQYAPQFTKKYNAAICADLDLSPLEGYEAIAGTEG